MGHDGDAMGRNGTQWGRKGMEWDTVGHSGDAVGTQWDAMGTRWGRNGIEWDTVGHDGTRWDTNGDAMGRDGTRWDAMGMQWDAMGRKGDAMGRDGTRWDAMGTRWGRNGTQWDAMGRNGTQGGRKGDAMGRNGTQWGRNGDAMGRNGTQWGRNGDAMGRNGDAMGTQWGRGKGGSRAKTEQPQNDPIWGPDVPGDAAAPIPMALKELMPPPPRDKGGDVTATITARGRKGNCMGRGETSAFGYTLTGAGTHGCSSATGRTGMGLLYPWLSPLLSPLLSPRLSPLLSPLPSPRLRTPTAGRDVCSAISAVILPKSSARMPSGPSLRGHQCPPELLGGQRGGSNGVEGTQMGWKGAPGSPAQMRGRTPRLRHHLQQHRGWGAMSPKGFVPTGGRESAATTESAAGRGQQRDGDNGTGTTAGRGQQRVGRAASRGAGRIPTPAASPRPRFGFFPDANTAVPPHSRARSRTPPRC